MEQSLDPGDGMVRRDVDKCYPVTADTESINFRPDKVKLEQAGNSEGSANGLTPQTTATGRDVRNPTVPPEFP